MVFTGAQEFVEFGGDAGRVHFFEGAEGDAGTREDPFGSGEISCPDAVAGYARRYERL